MDCPALHSRRCSKGLGSSSDGGLLFCFPVCCGHFYFMAAHKSSPPSFPLHPRAAAAGVGLPPPFTSGAISEANATCEAQEGLSQTCLPHALRKQQLQVRLSNTFYVTIWASLVPYYSIRLQQAGGGGVCATAPAPPSGTVLGQKGFPRPLVWAPPRLGKSSRR